VYRSEFSYRVCDSLINCDYQIVLRKRLNLDQRLRRSMVIRWWVKLGWF